MYLEEFVLASIDETLRIAAYQVLIGISVSGRKVSLTLLELANRSQP